MHQGFGVILTFHPCTVGIQPLAETITGWRRHPRLIMKTNRAIVETVFFAKSHNLLLNRLSLYWFRETGCGVDPCSGFIGISP